LLGVEPSQDVLTPLLQGAPEPGDLSDGAGRERGDDVFGDPPADAVMKAPAATMVDRRREDAPFGASVPARAATW
jgi:hypothetical protein